MYETPSTARQAFQAEMAQLEHDVLDMGAGAEAMVTEAAAALRQVDAEAAMRVVLKDDEIDSLELSIEGRCLRLLALQQPIAGDFRAVGTALKAVTDIERVADLAVDLARIAMKLDKEMAKTDHVDFGTISELAVRMLRLALQAYVRRDVDLLSEVARLEEQVDDLYRTIREQLFAHMRSNPHDVVADGWLLLAVYHLERVADHACNIAERVDFMVTGHLGHLGFQSG